jgi:hypothetical protein
MRRNPSTGRRLLLAETLEPRTLLSESASASVALVSTTGSGASTVYHYNITLKDTGTTAIGSFWFGWSPGFDYMKSMPTAVGGPSGWNHAVTNMGPSDGFAVQWVASTPMSAGQTLAGFTFSSADSPSALAGNSVISPTTPVGTSFVYAGAPFTDAGDEIVAKVAVTQSITGTVFADANANGKLDSGEKGLAGVKVYIDAKKTGAFVSTDPNTMTNSTGVFTFSNLASGTYRIREVLPANNVQTAPSGGFIDAVLSGSGAKGLLFADALATASISGTVFGDTNADGKIDNHELGLGLWQVFIDTNKDGKLESGEKVTTTNINGAWSFTGLVAGTYVVRVVPVSGAVATKPTGGVLTIVLTAGQASKGNLFGERAIT